MKQWHLEDNYGNGFWDGPFGLVVGFFFIFLIAHGIYESYPKKGPFIGLLLGIFCTYKATQAYFFNLLGFLAFVAFTLYSAFMLLAHIYDEKEEQ